MKKKGMILGALLVATLSVAVFAACRNDELPTSDKQWGDDYYVDKSLDVVVDDEVKLDGVLNEDFWVNSKTLCLESTAEYIREHKNSNGARDHFTDGSVTLATYFTEKSLYFGVTVKDAVLYGPGDALFKESSVELVVSLPTYYDIEHAYEVRFTASGLSRLARRYAGAYTATTASNLGCAVKIDGEGLNSANNVGYTVEGVIDWKDLGLEEKPSEIAVNTNFIRVQDVPTSEDYEYIWHDVGSLIGATYGDPRTWPVFDTNGYVAKSSVTPKAFTIDADDADWTGENPNTDYDPTKFVEIHEAAASEHKRTYKLRAVYITGDGLYAFMDVTHLNFSETNSWTTSTNVEIRISTTGKWSGVWVDSAYRAYGSKDISSNFGTEGFAINTVEEEGDGYNYRTKAEIYIPETSLQRAGVDTEAGIVSTFAFMPKGNQGADNEVCAFEGRSANHIWQIYDTVITDVGVEQSVELTEANVAAIDAQTFTGKEIKPDVALTYHNITINSDEYDVTYTGNTEAGTATAEITFTDGKAGRRFGEGSVEKTFTINPAPLSEEYIKGLLPTYSYTSKEIKPPITIEIDGVTISEENYTVDYTTNTDKGTATVTVTGQKSLSGKASKTFEIIESKSIDGAEIIIDAEGLVQTGSAVFPHSVTVKIDGETLEENEDYTLSYSDNVNLDLGLNPTQGTATVTVTFLKEYGGQKKTATYTFAKSSVSQIGINADPAKLKTTGIYAQTTPEELVAYGENEKKGFSYTAILREEGEGGGLYVFAEARLDAFDTAVENAFRIGLSKTETIGRDNWDFYDNFYLTIGNGAQKSGFDLVAVRVEQKDKARDGYTYHVYYEGFVSFATLTENNVSIDGMFGGQTANIAEWEPRLQGYSGKIVMLGAEYNAKSEDAIKCMGGETAGTSKWQILPCVPEANLIVSGTTIVIYNKQFVTTQGMLGNERGDLSRFEGKNKIEVKAKDTSDQRRAEFTLYYEAGVGVWFNFTAYHNVEPYKGIGGTEATPYFGVALTSDNVKDKLLPNDYRITYQGNSGQITGSVGGVRFGDRSGIYDTMKTVLWHETDAAAVDVNVKYITRAVGLIPVSKLEGLIQDGAVSIYCLYYGSGSTNASREQMQIADPDALWGTSNTSNWTTNYLTHTLKVTEDGVARHERITLNAENIEAIAEQTFTGKEITPDVTVTYQGKTISPDEYTVTYRDNTEAGEATAIVTFKASCFDFTGTVEKTFKINPAELSEDYIQGLHEEYAFTGEEIKPEITIVMNGVTISEDNYNVSYSSNTQVGTATVIVQGANSLSGQVEKTFQIIAPTDLTDVKIEIDDADLVQTGSAVVPAPEKIKVTFKGTLLTEGVGQDYTVTYSNNVNLDLGLNPEYGTATATFTFLKFGSQTKTATYKFRKSSVSQIGINADPAKLSTGGIYAQTTPNVLTANEKAEQRGFSYTAILREEEGTAGGGGLYVFAEARLDAFDTTVENAFRLGLSTTTKKGTDVWDYYDNFYLTIGNGAQKSGFDLVAVRVEQKEKSTDGYTYHVYYEGFVSFETLTTNHVSIDGMFGGQKADNIAEWEPRLNEYSGKIVMLGAEYNAKSEDAIKCMGGETAGTSKWQILPCVPEANLIVSETTIAIYNKQFVTTKGMLGNERGDLSRFEGKSKIEVKAKDTSDHRRAEFTLYYEAGVGVWFNFTAYHNVAPAKGIGDMYATPYFGVALTNNNVNGDKSLPENHRITYQGNSAQISGSVGGVRFGNREGIYNTMETVMWHETDAATSDANVKYVARAVGLIPESKLDGLIQDGAVSIYCLYYGSGSTNASKEQMQIADPDDLWGTSNTSNWTTNYLKNTLKVTADGVERVPVAS